MSLQVVNTQIEELGERFGNASALIAVRIGRNSLSGSAPVPSSTWDPSRYLSLASNRIRELPLEVFQSLGRWVPPALGQPAPAPPPSPLHPAGQPQGLPAAGECVQVVHRGAFGQLTSSPGSTWARTAWHASAQGLRQRFAASRVRALYENQLSEVPLGPLSPLQSSRSWPAPNQIRWLPARLFLCQPETQEASSSPTTGSRSSQKVSSWTCQSSPGSPLWNVLQELRPGDLWGRCLALRSLALRQPVSTLLAPLCQPDPAAAAGLEPEPTALISPSTLAGLGELLEVSLPPNQLPTLVGEPSEAWPSSRTSPCRTTAPVPAKRPLPTPHWPEDPPAAEQLPGDPPRASSIGLHHLRDVRLPDNPWRYL
ncbi:leucine-rich repeat-containing protein 15-like [Sceloporus undulatus]|uniref:leucine-rich repeat-containing protein 15-like n=1 Tax=Sceloporus undulatus TaxID=8520 RepID=UPI001C4CF1A5|nr:leucine-rich repeat-containing protein 15-like [Sceloporus undulatus]